MIGLEIQTTTYEWKIPSLSLEREEECFPPSQLAAAAVQALIAEADLTPKPALVDARSSGAHKDLNLEIMLRSANALQPCFQEIALISSGAKPSQALREHLAEIGRAGELAMYQATGGGNAHKGAIWALGLLVAGASICQIKSATAIARTAAEIARYSDSRYIPAITHGSSVASKFGVPGARGEARAAFPHVIKIGITMLQEGRKRGLSEHEARLDTLLAIMAELDDTCLLHRAGMTGLMTAKGGARLVLSAGGMSTREGRAAFHHLEQALLEQNASPGGSADLLAATLFLDSLIEPAAVFFDSTEGSRNNAKNEF
jgi:triphosphoribosyl-dephospho-CoA synthase